MEKKERKKTDTDYQKKKKEESKSYRDKSMALLHHLYPGFYSKVASLIILCSTAFPP